MRVVFLAAALVLGTSSLPAQSVGRPKIEVSTYVADLGELLYGEKRVYSFIGRLGQPQPLETAARSRELNDVTIVLILPGLLFTAITQGHWFRHKRILRNSGQTVDSSRAVTDSPQPRRPGPRRRVRRRASRTGGAGGRRR